MRRVTGQAKGVGAEKFAQLARLCASIGWNVAKKSSLAATSAAAAGGGGGGGSFTQRRSAHTSSGTNLTICIRSLTIHTSMYSRENLYLGICIKEICKELLLLLT